MNNLAISFYNNYAVSDGFIGNIKNLNIDAELFYYDNNLTKENLETIKFDKKNCTIGDIKEKMVSLPNHIYKFIEKNSNYDYILFLDTNCKYIIKNLQDYISNHLKIIDKFYIIVDNLADSVFMNNYIYNIPHSEVIIKLENDLEVKLLTNSSYGAMFVNLKKFKTEIKDYLQLFNPQKNLYRIYYLDKIIFDLFTMKKFPVIKSIAINNAINYNNVRFGDLFYEPIIIKETFRTAIYHEFRLNITTEKELFIRELDKKKTEILLSNNLYNSIIPSLTSI